MSWTNTPTSAITVSGWNYNYNSFRTVPTSTSARFRLHDSSNVPLGDHHDIEFRIENGNLVLDVNPTTSFFSGSANPNAFTHQPPLGSLSAKVSSAVVNVGDTINLYVDATGSLNGSFVVSSEFSITSSGSGTNNNNNNNSSGPVVIKTIDITPATPPNSDPAAWYAQWYVDNGQNYVFVLISQTTNLPTTNVIPLMKDKFTGVNISPTATLSNGDDSSTIVVIFEVDLDDLRNNYIQVYENTGVVPADGNPLLGSFDMQRRKVSCNFW